GFGRSCVRCPGFRKPHLKDAASASQRRARLANQNDFGSGGENGAEASVTRTLSLKRTSVRPIPRIPSCRPSVRLHFSLRRQTEASGWCGSSVPATEDRAKALLV